MFSLIALYFSYRRQVKAEGQTMAMVPAAVTVEPQVELLLAA